MTTQASNFQGGNRDNEEGKMTIFEHLAELRTRLLWSMGALGLATALTFLKNDLLFEILKSPAEGVRFQVIEPTEAFAAYIKVALLGGLIISLPMHIYQIVMFINPGLLPNEKRLLYTFLPFASISFFGGIVFGYFVLLPPAVQFLLNFGPQQNIAEANIRIASYIDLVTRLLFWIGISFETPMFMFILGRLGIISYSRIAPLRRYFVVVAWVIAALITPTFDPVNQTLVAVPLMALFEIGAQLVRIFGRR